MHKLILLIYVQTILHQDKIFILSMSINISDYTTLNTYAVLAHSGITSVGTTNIDNGNYGSWPNASYTGTINGTVDSGNAETAQEELILLVEEIDNISITATTTGGSGTITYTPGRYNSTSSINYDNATIIFDAQGNNNAQFFITASTDIVFDGKITILVTSGIELLNIFWLAGNNINTTQNIFFSGIFIAMASIEFENTSTTFGRLYAQTDHVTFLGPSNVDGLVTPMFRIIYSGNDETSGTAPVDPNSPYLSGSPVTVLGNTGNLEKTGYDFAGWNSSSDGTGITLQPGETFDIPFDVIAYALWTPTIICYAKGSLILTNHGFVPIENMKAGDTIVTKGKIHNNEFIKNEDLKVENVKWISKFKVFELNSESTPICITKNALGKNKPFKDLYVSPNHGLLINNKLIAARNMLNGTTIYQDIECDEVIYYHLECEKHSAIFANGILSESYLDANNRDVFENSIKVKHTPNKPISKHKLARIIHQ